MLEVEDLHATINGKEVSKGISLVTKTGEVYAIMRPNGSGKSTSSVVLAGNPVCEVTQGEVTFNGEGPLAIPPESRAHEGLFLSLQYPVGIPGVPMTNSMRVTINERQKYQG